MMQGKERRQIASNRDKTARQAKEEIVPEERSDCQRTDFIES